MNDFLRAQRAQALLDALGLIELFAAIVRKLHFHGFSRRLRASSVEPTAEIRAIMRARIPLSASKRLLV